MTEREIEQALIEKLGDLKYTNRQDIRDRAALEHNVRHHFEALNRVHLTDTEFARLLESIVTPDVFAAARHLRERNSFERDDGTPLYYTLVNIMARITRYASQTPGKQKMSRDELIGLMQQLFPLLSEAPA
jgi:type I restriction enzyme R subunit